MCAFRGCVGVLFTRLLELDGDFQFAAFATAAPPTWGEHTLHQSVASASSSGTGSLRTVAWSLSTPGRNQPCLFDLFKRRLFERIKHRDVAFRGEFLTMSHRDLVRCLHGHPQGLLLL